MEIIEKMVSVVDSEATGDKARIERVILRLTQEEVAKKMGVSKNFLSLLERGKRKWNKKHIDAFNKAIKELK